MPVRPSTGKFVVPVRTPEPVIADLAVGARGSEVLRIQQRLAVLGFFFTAEDGIYGANTKNAILDFENYLRLLEQDEIDRVIEANKTPEPTQTPVPTNSPAHTQMIAPEWTEVPSVSPDAAIPTEAAQTPVPTATPVPTPTPTPLPTPETVADGMADSALQKLIFGDAEALYRRDAQKNDAGADVLRIQRRLVGLNYLNDEPDGSYGINTENAVKAFQLVHDLNATGAADRATQKILFSTEALRAEKPVYNQLYLGETGEDVKTVQRQLRLLGFTNSKVSGNYDKNTEAAVRLMETHLYQLEQKEKGIELMAPEETNVPEEVLESQGEITGDPEMNPYEVLPGEETDETHGESDVSATIQPAASAGPVDDFAPTGIMTAEMQILLLEEGIPVYLQTVQKGDSGEQVKRVQRRLYALGYLTANGVDGIFGKGSEKAVSEFQRRNKLTETGIADQNMQVILFSEGAVRSIKPYQIKISVDKQRVYVYAHDEFDEYNILVKEFKCSTGLRDTPTPLGTFTNTGPGARWHYFKKFECWAQYAYYINGDIMFHSVIYNEQDEDTLVKSSLNNLGKRASHGCVRLAVADAKWIYENCAAGTVVIVY